MYGHTCVMLLMTKAAMFLPLVTCCSLKDAVDAVGALGAQGYGNEWKGL